MISRRHYITRSASPHPELCVFPTAAARMRDLFAGKSRGWRDWAVGLSVQERISHHVLKMQVPRVVHTHSPYQRRMLLHESSLISRPPYLCVGRAHKSSKRMWLEGVRAHAQVFSATYYGDV